MELAYSPSIIGRFQTIERHGLKRKKVESPEKLKPDFSLDCYMHVYTLVFIQPKTTHVHKIYDLGVESVSALIVYGLN